MRYFSYLKNKVYDGDNLMNITDIRYLPRWTILVFDILILLFSLFFAFLVYRKLLSSWNYHLGFDQMAMLFLFVNVFYMFIFKTYAGIIRHSTFVDLFKLLLASVCTVLTLFVLNMGVRWFTGIKLLPSVILIMVFTISFTLMFVFRFLVKEFFHVLREFRRSTLKKRILVLGIDEQSIAIARVILDNPNLPYQVVGFLTQRSDSNRAKILGKPILAKDKFMAKSKQLLGVDGIIIQKDAMSREEMNFWVNIFLEKGLQVLKAPSVQKLRSSDLAAKIKNLQIEDLLNRKPIKIENEEVKKRHYGKTILVTGGAGSIGSEIVRQVALFEPSLIVVLDQAETPLYDIELEMRNKFPLVSMKFVLMDITNHHRLEKLFTEFRFSMVYHAAAYKHVPLVEENPQEGIRVNILGTKSLALLASKYKVNRFVMVSTDKAVNPTNVMGASKRTAELIVQSLQNQPENTTKFIATRFGNVLGSNGSVIPLFKKQIASGGPLTITHPDIVRYFMTISEACELVLQAGTMGSGGEIYVFDMGEPVRIVDLARRMIKLSGFEPDTDIKIVYTGLRPGEKLFEELLSDDTKTLPTHNEKIMVSKDMCAQLAELDNYIDLIAQALLRNQNEEAVSILKKIVPEYKSNNSVYESLDK